MVDAHGRWSLTRKVPWGVSFVKKSNKGRNQTVKKSNLRRLITLQKRVVRIMSRSAFDAHTDPLFKNLKLLNLESIYKLQIGKFMYQYRSGLLPYSFNNMFLVTRQVHSYGTRSSEHFYLPQCRTNIRKFSISFQGPKFFNSLSFEIRNATSTASFCCKLKAFLLS